MKLTIFYAFIFLFAVCLVSCQKENLIDSNQVRKVSAVIDSSKVKSESGQLKMAQLDNYSLNYIGNSQWSGNWHGSQLTFDGPADYQMNDGLQHYYNLSTSFTGGGDDVITYEGGGVWSVLHWLASTNWNASMPKVDWVSKQTGQVLYVSDNVISPIAIMITSYEYQRRVSTYTAPICIIGGAKAVTFKVQIIEVDHVPNVCSPVKVGSAPVDPNAPPW